MRRAGSCTRENGEAVPLRVVPPASFGSLRRVDAGLTGSYFVAAIATPSFSSCRRSEVHGHPWRPRGSFVRGCPRALVVSALWRGRSVEESKHALGAVWHLATSCSLLSSCFCAFRTAAFCLSLSSRLSWSVCSGCFVLGASTGGRISVSEASTFACLFLPMIECRMIFDDFRIQIKPSLN